MGEGWECPSHRRECGAGSCTTELVSLLPLGREGQDSSLGNVGEHTPILRKHSASPSCTVNMCVPVPWKRNRTLKSVN